MTRKCVADDKYGSLQRRLGEYARRIDEGALEFGPNFDLLQSAIEGKLIGLIKSGGLVLSKPLDVLVEYTGDEKILGDNGLPIRVKKEDRDALFHPLDQAYRIALQFAHFEFFGDPQPNTEEVVGTLSRRGFRQASAVELSCAVRRHKLEGQGTEYIVALDSTHAGLERVARFEKTSFGLQEHGVKLTSRNQPWWPYCYRFAVVKMK